MQTAIKTVLDNCTQWE